MIIYIYIYKSVCICSKDRHSCLNLYPCVIKFNQSINQSLSFSGSRQTSLRRYTGVKDSVSNDRDHHYYYCFVVTVIAITTNAVTITIATSFIPTMTIFVIFTFVVMCVIIIQTNLKQNEAQSARVDVPLVEFMYLVFTRMPGESYRRRLRSLLLYLCYVFRALINSLVC